jgi:cation:H+ antiporter
VSFVLVFIGVVLLYLGGEVLVKNSSLLARNLGISPLVIGLTVVAFGTSSPELAATLASAFRGVPEVALGNVIGSNIANLGLILGLTALLYPLRSTPKFLRRELPFMIIVSALTFPMLFDGSLGRLEGVLLVGLLGLYLLYQFRGGEAPPLEALVPVVAKAQVPTSRAALGAIFGVVLLVLGAQALVEGAVTLARGFGISERVIGLTLVAIGTSLPELASSLVAALKREGEIILGNIIGSNIFNVLAILGITALVRPITFAFAPIRLDLWVMMGLSFAVILLMLRGARLGRLAGALLLCLYLIYSGSLFV